MTESIYYHLVQGLPPIALEPSAEQIGRTWQHGIVYAQPLIQLFFRLLAEHGKPFIAVDVGAQTGSFTLLSKYFPESVWVAFEPLQEAAVSLQQSLRLNDIRNVTLVQAAVSHSAGKATLNMPEAAEWGLCTLGTQPLRFSKVYEREVDCITLDQFQETKRLGRVDFLKIDTEGWELHVLQGAKKMLAQDRPTILMELNETNMRQCNLQKEDVLQCLDQMGYRYSMVTDEDLLCVPCNPPAML